MNTIEDRILAEAAQLFALQGFRKTSLRQIAKAAELSNASHIAYYFKSKASLFQAVIQVSFGEAFSVAPFEEILAASPPNTPLEATAALNEILMILFADGLKEENLWQTQLAAQLMTAEHLDLLETFLASFAPLDAMLDRLVAQAGGVWSQEERTFWYDLFWSQCSFYVLSKDIILLENNRSAYDEAFIQRAAWRVSRTCLLALGIPLGHIRELEHYRHCPCPVDLGEASGLA